MFRLASLTKGECSSFMFSADRSDVKGVSNNQGHVLKVPGSMFFICVLKSHSNVICLSCPGDDLGVAVLL